ncbi:oligosaccharide flippase family protein [Flavobacterium sp. FlaQc-48]|uniref:oligosaccharide flippase family protein n=1 Tax=Flavobacterium sp. FlaQc-48 TaxID=3374181 RepID=UPI0037578944
MSESKSSYLHILKTTSLFGLVQLFSIIISIIRIKLISVFIGPAGIGITSLLSSSINIISGVCGLGIETSSIKHISSSYKNEDLNTVSKTVSIVRKLVLFTGVLGTSLTIIFSNWLSIIAFGNSSHMYSFIFLSITLLFKQLSVGHLVVLQGLRKMKLLAKANFYGNLLGLIFSIPLYYYYQIDAIVPTFIIASFSALVFSYYYSKKVKIKISSVKRNQLIVDGKDIIRLGIMLAFSGLLTLFSTYLIQIYIGKYGSIEQVGLFSAGFTLLNSYVGIIFTIMSTDYFPRLSSICNDNYKIRISVMQQALVSVLIITPIIILFLIFIPLIIRILYTSKFVSIIPMVCFGILAMLFKAVSWSMGFILIAKGESAIFIKTAIGFSCLSLFLNVLGYYFYKLEGLGISFLIYYLIHFFIVKMITKKRYGFYFDKKFYQIYLICIVMCSLTFLFRYIPNQNFKYSLMSIMAIISIGFVFFEINKKMDLKEMFNSLLKKIK